MRIVREDSLEEVTIVVQWKREYRILKTQSPRSSLRPPHKPWTKEGIGSGEVDGAKSAPGKGSSNFV